MQTFLHFPDIRFRADGHWRIIWKEKTVKENAAVSFRWRDDRIRDPRERKIRRLPHKFEAGTVNAAGAIALHAAIKYAQSVGFE